jgi:hypothetical protein
MSSDSDEPLELRSK